MSLTVEGRRSWQARGGVPEGSFRLAEAEDGRVAAVSGRATVAQPDGQVLELVVDVQRIVDSLLGSVVVTNRSTGKSVYALVAQDVPQIGSVGEGRRSVRVVAEWGSFYRGEWFPGTVEFELIVGGLESDPGGLVIEEGREAINRFDVTLGVRASAGATEMRLANGDDPSGGEWVPVAAEVPWVLPEGDGVKVVSAEFRGGSSGGVVSASILVDTVPPAVTIDSHGPGSVVDGRDGSIVTVDGSATDDGSGVASVVFEDGEGDPRSVGLEDEVWAAPVSPVTSGPGLFRATATDAAGNESVAEMAVVLEAPPGTGTLIRPGVLEVDAALAADLLRVSPDGASVVFSGDKRAVLDSRTLLVASTLPSGTAEGLLHRVLSVSYDAASDETRVVTEFGSLLDVFARYEPPEPPPELPAARAQAAAADVAAGPDACDDFRRNRTIDASIDLPAVKVVHPDGSARGELDLEAAVVADSTLRIRGLSLSGKITGGFMLCGVSETEALGSLGSGVKFFQGPSVGVGDTIKDGLKALTIAIGPVVLTPQISADLAPLIDLAAASYEETGFNVGLEAGVKLGSGLPEFILDPIVDSETRALRPAADKSEWGASLTLSFGFITNGVISTDLFSGGLKLTRRTDPEWVGTPGQQGAYVTKVKFGICATPIFRIGLTLDVGFQKKLFGVDVGYSLNLIDIGKDFELPPRCPSALQSEVVASTTPPAITTASLPAGERGSAYISSVESPDPYVTWDADGLPEGLITTGGGSITGTPTEHGSFTVTVSATGLSRRTTTRTYQLVIADNFRILTANLKPVTIGVAYSEQLEANEPATWELAAGTLAEGLTLSPDGLISGTPSSEGSESITVQATRGDGRTASKLIEFYAIHPTTRGFGFVCKEGDGDIWCVGRGDLGQLGDGRMETSPQIARRVEGLSTVADLTSGMYHACALEADGSVKCWGATEGRRTNGRFNAIRPRATRVQFSAPATQFDSWSGIGSIGCAVLVGATVECWEVSGELLDTDNGDPGDDETPFQIASTMPQPVHIAAFDGAVEVRVGGGHVCVRFADGRVMCAGDNENGEAGSPDLTERRSAFDGQASVVLPAAAEAIGAGEESSCALTSSAEVWCWGANGLGQLGTGEYQPSSSWRPVKVAGLERSMNPLSIGKPVQLASYDNYHCVLSETQRVGCWGANGEITVTQSPIGAISAVNPPAPITAEGVPVPGSTVYKDVVKLHDGDRACYSRRSGADLCWWNNPWVLELFG